MHAYEPNEYRDTRMFVTPDDMAGFALKSDGDIVSAFKHDKSKAVDAGDSLLALAVQQGGRKLDAFDTVLPELYSHNGFRAVARIPWDDKEAPPGWDKKTFIKFNRGEPDVVFMVYDPERAKPYKPGDGERVASYGEGIAAQDRALSEIKKAFDPNEPRDESGKWTDGGGDAGGDGKPKGEHPGKGYSKNAYVDDKGVIHTSNVYDAQRALFEDRKVELKQVKQISTLIKRLGETAKEMAEHGEAAPVFNLCNVSVEGTNLFCSQQKNIPRAEMPVIPAKRTKEFIKYLKSEGYKVEKDNERAAHLRATQSEISGAKVAVQMERIRKEGFYKRLVISRDDYILDGHHTWAGQLGIDAQDNNLHDDKSVKVARVDISIIKLIAEADKWTKEHGIAKKPASEAAKAFRRLTLAQAAQELPPILFRKYYMRAQEFFAANDHLDHNINDVVIVVRAFETRRATTPLYVHRDLLNIEAFTAWAKAQGFSDVADDLHVTVLYSKAAVAWSDMKRDGRGLVVPAGGARSIEQLGDEGAVVLRFESAALAQRHDDMVASGASHDYDSYAPHLTINLSGTIPDGAVPYDGELVFGPEIFEKIEKAFDPELHPHQPAGSPEGGQFAPTGGGGAGGAAEEEAGKLNPKVIEVGGDEWNKATARRLEREYQQARPKLDKITNEAVGKSVKGSAAWGALSEAEQLDVFNQWRKDNKIDDYDKAKEAWDELSDTEKAKINADQLSMTEDTDEDEDEDAPYYPESWDELSTSQQSEVDEAWMEDNKKEFYDSEVSNWQDNGDALDDAKSQLTWEFTKHDNIAWADEAFDELAQEREEAGKTLFPFTRDQILTNMTLDYDNGNQGQGKTTFEFNDKGLDEETPLGPLDIDPAQQHLPGIEPPKPSELLTDDMRADIEEALKKAFDNKADDMSSEMEPPEYLQESADEFVEQVWNEKSDKEKFNWAYEHDKVNKPESETADAPAEDQTKVEALPAKFDPLNEASDANYKRTQKLARYLSMERANELLIERGLRQKPVDAARIRQIDKTLWEAWKGSSTSQEGMLLQVATAEELGGRLNTKTSTSIDVDNIKSNAEHRYADIGGYAGVKAYIRAKWETTQYLLDRAGQHELELYRGIDLNRYDPARYEQAVREKADAAKQVVTSELGGKYDKAPTIKIDRNGAASATTDPSIANGWKKGQSGNVVLRALVPRTAAISIPAYGINIHSEHEVVIAGTAWKSWDAWLDNAPYFDLIPIGPSGSGIGTNAPKLAAAA